MPLDPQAAVVIEMIDAAGLGELTPETDPQAIRNLMDAMALPGSVAVADVEDRVIPGPAKEIRVRCYRPAGSSAKPVIVYYHGGGWVLGSLETHDGICRVLADGADAVVVSVEYRMAPEHRFPAAVDDAYAALCWVHEHASELGADATRLAVAGDSAGGNLSAVVAQLARDGGGPSLRFQLLVYPVTDYEFESRSMVENGTGYYLTADAMRWFYGHYLSTPADAADPRVSPLRGELAGLAPAMVITAEYDPLRDQGIAYADALRAAGTPVEARDYSGVFHGFFGMQDMIDVSKVALDDAVSALRVALAAG